MTDEDVDVLIVGAGPAGLRAARALFDRGVDKFVVVEREDQTGGIPRYCPHPTFGVTDFHRPMSGSRYAQRLARLVDPGAIRTRTSVTAISADLGVTLSTPAGEMRLWPRRILLATGIRETPRPARLVSGDRPLGVFTTGALQRLLAVGGPLPFRRPLIVGTELVAFSAALNLRERGLHPVAMVEAADRIQTVLPAGALTRFVLGVPVLTRHRIVAIEAAAEDPSRLEAVAVATPGGPSRIACDAVIFTGQFTPETSLLAGPLGHLLDAGSRGPAIDQCWRLADPRFYAAGNVLRSIETAAWCGREGAAAGHAIADDLVGHAPAPQRRVPVVAAGPVEFVTPSAISVPGPAPGGLQMTLRVARPARGRITLAVDGAILWRSPSFTARSERRLHISRPLPDLAEAGAVVVDFEESSR